MVTSTSRQSRENRNGVAPRSGGILVVHGRADVQDLQAGEDAYVDLAQVSGVDDQGVGVVVAQIVLVELPQGEQYPDVLCLQEVESLICPPRVMACGASSR